MRNKLNPELKKDDRIVLVHMDGESLGAGIKGKVTGIENVPKFTSSDIGVQYRVEWYDESNNIFSMLSLIPETDAWIIDTDYEVESLQEIKIKDVDDLVKIGEFLSLFDKGEINMTSNKHPDMMDPPVGKSVVGTSTLPLNDLEKDVISSLENLGKHIDCHITYLRVILIKH